LAFCISRAAGAAAIPATIPSSIVGPACEQLALTLVKQERLPVGALSRATTHTALPAGAAVLIVAEEQGADLRIEVTAGKASPLASDNPVRRWAWQRVLIEPGAARTLTIAVMGKERVSGEALVSVYAWSGASDSDTCMPALRLLARADAHFDQAQGTTRGRVSSNPGSSADEYRAAAAAYAEAAKLVATRPANQAQAHATLARAELLYQGLDAYADARAAGALAVEQFAAAAEPYGQLRARTLVALAGLELARAAGAGRAPVMMRAVREEFVALASSYDARGELFDAAQAINNAGLTAFYEREFEAALGHYGRALVSYEKLGEATRRTQVKQNIAATHQELVRPRQARAGFLQALSELRREDDPKLYADMLNNLALAEYRLGMPDESLLHYSQALDLLTRIQVPREQARSLNGIGYTYYDLGNLAVALDYFKRALALRPRELDPAGRVVTLRAIADTERDAGRFDDAVRLREDALELSQNAHLIARARVDLARDLTESGDHGRAAAELARVFDTDLAGDPIGHARALQVRAQLALSRQDFAAADRDAREAAERFAGLEQQSARFGALMLRLRAVCARGDRAAAQRIADESLGLAEQLRAASDNPMLRASLWAQLRQAFDFRIRLAAEHEVCGQPGAVDARLALSLSERARNRALEDFQRTGAARATPGATEPERRRAEYFDQIADVRAQIEIMGKRDRIDLARLESRRTELAGLRRQIDIVEAQIANAPSTRRRPRSLEAAIERIPAHTAVVEYWLGEKHSYAWLTAKGKVQMIDLGDTTRIDTAARELHAAMRGFTTISPERRQRASSALYALIIAPLPAALRGARSLYFIPDGTLHGVPFAALTDGAGTSPTYLMDRHDVGIAASILSFTGLASTPPADVRALIVADPVYSADDERLGRQTPAGTEQVQRISLRGGGWTRLPASGREANAIAAIFGAGNIDLLMGFDASRENLLGRDLARFRVLHFATHAVADMQAPQFSSLVLSTIDARGTSRPGEVFAGDFLFRRFDADLVVFSGCDTALGQAAPGEGLLGLRYAAHAAGARTVVASLWPVVDTVGETFMKDFYTALIRERRAPVTALSSAMRAARARWPDPALWSVFVVSSVDRAETIH
jgi:CHAT domain-containing protein